MITISIDVTLLDKARFKEVVVKDGHTAKFCDIVLIETPTGKFGDYMVKQDTTKEEREAKVQMPILGNGKIRGGAAKPRGEHSSRPQTRPAPPQKRPTADLDAPEEESIPF